jgi:hypothetical protein
MQTVRAQVHGRRTVRYGKHHTCACSMLGGLLARVCVAVAESSDRSVVESIAEEAWRRIMLVRASSDPTDDPTSSEALADLLALLSSCMLTPDSLTLLCSASLSYRDDALQVTGVLLSRTSWAQDP